MITLPRHLRPLCHPCAAVWTAFAAALASPSTLAAPPRSIGPGSPALHGTIVVANRGSGDLSIIDVRRDTVAATVPLPPDAARPEPMYVVHTAASDRLWVGDRANHRLVVLHGRTYAVEDLVPAGRGIWHMWADDRSGQLWVANDVDRTATVVSLVTREVLATVPIPADLAAAGGRPHDVVIDPRGHAAYLSISGLPGADDFVVRYDTETLLETGRAAVGKDPHLAVSGPRNLVLVPCQNSSEVVLLAADSLLELGSVPIPGAHGACLSRDGGIFFTTNLPGQGHQALWTLDTRDGSEVAPPVDTPFPVPHNLALTPNDRKLYVTHSGPTSTWVTVFHLRGPRSTPEFAASVPVGLNPFGLTYAP